MSADQIKMVCGAPSMRGPSGLVLRCEREPKHRGRHRHTYAGHRYEWGGSGPSGPSTPHRERSGERIEVQLGVEASRCLKLLIERLGGTRRAHIERAIVAEYRRVAR